MLIASVSSRADSAVDIESLRPLSISDKILHRRELDALRLNRQGPEADDLIDAAQDEPVFIERNRLEVAVLVSARDYDRLSGKATREFLDFCDKMAGEAAANGLTEENLQEILDRA